MAGRSWGNAVKWILIDDDDNDAPAGRWKSGCILQSYLVFLSRLS